MSFGENANTEVFADVFMNKKFLLGVIIVGCVMACFNFGILFSSLGDCYTKTPYNETAAIPFMMMLDAMLWGASSVFNGAIYSKISGMRGDGGLSSPLVRSQALLFVMLIHAVPIGMTMMQMIIGCHLVIKLLAILSLILHLSYVGVIFSFLIRVINELLLRAPREIPTVSFV